MNDNRPRFPYEAYGIMFAPDSLLVHIDIFRNDGETYRIQDARLKRIVDTDGEYCSLLYDKCVVELTGRNLAYLPVLFHSYTPSFFQCVVPECHLPPKPEQPVIDRIRWQTVLKMEERLILRDEYLLNSSMVSMIPKV